ncbi:MAG: 2-oxoglutarate dehydrogenase E1 component, partial [Verrucomicrobiota bacterium]
MKNLSFANRWNADLIDQNYEAWLENPDGLDPQWRAFFEGFELAQSIEQPASAPSGGADSIIQSRVIGAIYAYRSIGHTQANYNPLRKQVLPNPRLSLERLGLEGIDPEAKFHTGNYLGGTFMTVPELIGRMNRTYCGHIGCEYIHIQETPKRRWIQAKIEPQDNQPQFTREQKVRILRKVMEAETFERFLHTRYVGQKRFSLEGSETLIPAMDALVEKCPSMNVEEIVMGMAHRGRLNVLANILGKSYAYIFREFSANYIPDTIHGDGDVKYHLGYETVRPTSGGSEVEIRLAANPSHLEAVNPVVQGKARARQRIRSDWDRKRVLPFLVHGDAAFAGQGVVMETLNLSRLKGYMTGGTIHFVINNQIGFTTDPRESRSSRYCTDIAKMIEVPIFHVNGDDPLAVVSVMELALDYRQEFGDDVVIDMYCYRKHGHNESDEPGFTQPGLYKQISQHESISKSLRRRLVEEGTLTDAEADELNKEYQEMLDSAFLEVKQREEAASKTKKKRSFEGAAATIQPPYSFVPIKTSVPKSVLTKVADVLTTIPANFKANGKIQRQLETKWKKFLEGGGIDWAFAEQLAWGTLMLEGTPVRLSGQDSERGTFSQRHAAIYDVETKVRYVPLLNLDPDQASFCVHNSSLSEAAVLGFDFGYSLDYPEMLAI